jgi:uncharacterized coiled-coil DUF342 family protein
MSPEALAALCGLGSALGVKALDMMVTLRRHRATQEETEARQLWTAASDLRRDMYAQIKETREAAESLRHENERLHVQIGQLQEIIRDLERERDSLHTECEGCKRQMSEIRADLSRLSEENARLMRRIAGLEDGPRRYEGESGA